MQEYKKHNSFFIFKNKNPSEIDKIYKYCIDLLEKNELVKKFDADDQIIIKNILEDFKNYNIIKKDEKFLIQENSYAELNTYDEDSDKIKYLIHRYRYEIFPLIKKLHKFPPLIQIEPSSICNFRCVFCFETDKTFTNKKNGHMGTMELELFKNIVDQIQGKVEFVTLASRGEPLVSKSINKMLEYSAGKFLNLKINTNASLLDESKIHAILSSGVKTVVFSADAADSKLYAKLRVNGNLEKTLANIKLFKDIKDKHYSKNKLITRVSGVKFNKEQKFEDMYKLWSELVDQVVFVNYNPWENSYDKPSNTIKQPCSDLWRRMFIWWDGKINPCDVDYKSKLLISNVEEKLIKDSWQSENYNLLRKQHLEKMRSSVSPCNACTLV